MRKPVTCIHCGGACVVKVRGKPVRGKWNLWREDDSKIGRKLHPVPLLVGEAGILYYAKPCAKTSKGLCFSLKYTGRTVEDIGGVWLGPCEPPKMRRKA